jgi:predicted esterase
VHEPRNSTTTPFDRRTGLVSRRRFLAVGGAAAAGCAASATRPLPEDTAARIAARPGTLQAIAGRGEHPLGLGGRRDGVLVVPSESRADGRAPFMVLLHGAGGSAAGVRPLFAIAEEFRVVVLAPDSRGSTWDAIRGRFGADVAFLNEALRHAFERLAVDPRRLAIGGFSDGASYALALALANGDLFTHVLAFSPGFLPQAPRHGKPRVFISHGTQDDVLPVEQTSGVIVPDLQQRGYYVRYREFGGGHTVPRAVVREAFHWFTH